MSQSEDIDSTEPETVDLANEAPPPEVVSEELPPTDDVDVPPPGDEDAPPLQSHADELLDEEVAAVHRADEAMPTFEEVTELLRGDAAPPPVFTLKLVQFSEEAGITSGGFVFSEDGSPGHPDWTLGSTQPEDLDDVLRAFQPFAYATYNLVTGEHQLKGFAGELTPAHEQLWEQLVATLPAWPPLAQKPSEQPLLDPAAIIEETKRLAAEELEQRQQAKEAHLAGFLVQLAALPSIIEPINFGAVNQGLQIAADAARERRVKYPHSTPEGSVAAVEALPRMLKEQLLLAGCYRDLAFAAALGADVALDLEVLEARIKQTS